MNRLLSIIVGFSLFFINCVHLQFMVGDKPKLEESEEIIALEGTETTKETLNVSHKLFIIVY